MRARWLVGPVCCIVAGALPAPAVAGTATLARSFVSVSSGGDDDGIGDTRQVDTLRYDGAAGEANDVTVQLTPDAFVLSSPERVRCGPGTDVVGAGNLLRIDLRFAPADCERVLVGGTIAGLGLHPFRSGKALVFTYFDDSIDSHVRVRVLDRRGRLMATGRATLRFTGQSQPARFRVPLTRLGRRALGRGAHPVATLDVRQESVRTRVRVRL